jgi:molybdopterin/thiamine biosynthesis adenylyltransferase/molybdopterin synthase catalytic subunit/rhodanese-related sulfurtransferase
MFELTDQLIDSAALRARLARPEAGALVVFEGWVRNHHAGRPVSRLEYEAFDELARLEGEAITAEAEQEHPGCVVLCVHRTGSLGIGELAVWIGVASPHRHATFLACRQVIEEIKRRLPVWKKEHHSGNLAEWVNCTTEATANRLGAQNYYERQASLPEVGATGQAALAAASVLVVGVGGLGCPAALYLATSGVGRLTLADAGGVEVSNLHRQILFTADDIGAAKATVAAARLRAQNPLVRIEAHATDVTSANVRALVTGRTVVLDCTDNFAARFLLHDACRFAGVPLVSAAVYRFEGELNVFLPHASGCLHCLWTGRPAGELEAVANCAGAPAFAPAVGIFGVMQAAETLKLILRLGSAADAKQTRLINLLDGSIQDIERLANPSCPVCGHPVTSPPATLNLPDPSPVVLAAEDLAALGPMQTIALLEPDEFLDATIAPANTIAVPMGDLVRIRELAVQGPSVLTCRHGLRSAAVARLLRAEGLPRIYALLGVTAAIRPARTSPGH